MRLINKQTNFLLQFVGKIRVIARICLTKWAFTVIIWAVCVLCILFVCDFSGTVLLSHDVLILKKEVF